MNINYGNILFSTKENKKSYKELLEVKPFEPFSDKVIDYLNILSKEIYKDSRTREYPDVATFAFFCRIANMRQLKKIFYNQRYLRFGRGTVFHITPSNVPINFAFSLVAGLISGNLNIVKVPSKNFDQINIIVDALHKISIISKHKFISNRIILTKYDHLDKATEYFSLNCDVRIIWGGDETIKNIRKNQLSVRAFDITFSDRYSICIINSDKYVNEINHGRIASDFYNDTYLSDQKSCSAPHLIIWFGSNNNVEKSKKIFWEALHEIIKEKYKIQPALVVDNLTNFFDQSIRIKSITKQKTPDNLLWRVNLSELTRDIEDFKSSGGYFCEYHAESIDDLVKIINRRYQTLSYYGFSKKQLEGYISTLRPLGIDRVVPIGRTMDFSFNWDGYNLVNILSREIDIH